jgi:6-phosphogluconolactonase (cycloisomerase 2 family)
MPRSLVLCLLVFTICASTVLASAQVTSSPTESATSSAGPVAYVYVVSAPTTTTAVVYGAAAGANGALTSIPGSPFQYNVNYIAASGRWLFGVTNADEDIDSFAIGSNGALTLKDTYVVTANGDGVISEYFDHTGSTLYADLYSTNNDYLSYSIDQATGQITAMGDLGGGPGNGSPLSFIGNNVYAYSSSCYHFGAEIVGVQRASNGMLSYLSNFNPSLPAEKSGGFYCPWLAAADPTNHLAIAIEPLNSNWNQDGPWQLAVYTADGSGNLTTTSTNQNMPSVLVGTVNDYAMSPSGKYLAVGGTAGLQIFHFNGTNPITKCTSLLTSDPVSQLVWDNANHLYVISYSAGKVFVYNVTSAGVKQAPGSPYAVVNPQNIVVLPK